MQWTNEQNAIFEDGLSGSGHTIVTARAGAAKTSSMVELAKRIPRNKSGLALAFNTSIRDELKERLPGNFRAMTLNGCGFEAWRRYIRKPTKVDKDKIYNLFTEITGELEKRESDELWEKFSEIRKAVSMAKAAGYLPIPPSPAFRPLTQAGDFYAIHNDFNATDLEREAIDEILRRSWQLTLEGILDFDDMLLAPAVAGVGFDHFDYVLVDEAQDLSMINHVLLKKIVKGTTRLIAVGDPCQPDGTLITRVIERANRWHPAKLEQVPIEEIREGDTVLGYNGEGAFLYDRKVEGITRRPYEGELISITGFGFASRYTPNHHCYVSFESLRNRHALYLMQRGEVFRLGICKMDYGDIGSGPIVRAKHEDADAVWLLETYETEREAFKHEAFYQAKFGIPDLTFIEPSSNFDRGFLSAFWLMCESLNLERRARECLTFFGRDYAYPLWEKGQPYTSLKRPTVTYACNLLTGCLMLPFTGESKVTRAAWQPVDVGREPYSGFVTSFTVSDNHLYVADSLVTHNCQAIYGFRGADSSSMETLRSLFSAKELFLTTSFRCSRAVCENARWRAPDMNSPAWAVEGKVEVLPGWTSEDIPDGAAIICRNNAPLFALAIRLIRAGRYPELKGRDIIKGLVTTMKKLGKGTLTRDEALKALAAWEAAEKLRQKDKHLVSDRADCMRLFINETETLKQAIAFAEGLGQQTGRLHLMTGHGSKGLEYDHVFFLDQHLIDRKRGQDENVEYVIITRAKMTLTYITSEGFADAKTAENVSEAS